MKSVSLTFEDVRNSAGPIKGEHEALLYICADFRLDVHGRRLYDEIELPIVELAQALHEWRKLSPDKTGAEFRYQSMESDLDYLIAFIYTDAEWIITSPHEYHQETNPVPTRDLLAETDSYIQRVRDAAKNTFRINLRRYGLLT